MDAKQILNSWQRTNQPETNIADADWKTLFAMVDKGLLDAVAQAQELARVQVRGCPVCGGMTARIRGRHPGDAARVVCPLCLADRMNDINSLSSVDYGVASEAKSCVPPAEPLYPMVPLDAEHQRLRGAG